MPTNPSLPSRRHKGTQLLDCVYWAVTIMLGAADKTPTTMAGRTIIVAHLSAPAPPLCLRLVKLVVLK